jgi:PGF-CTERM protein
MIIALLILPFTIGSPPTEGSTIEMDRSLSASLASFLGESSPDFSGIDVSGAGDVNGDGYDDFLIGAVQNDEGGTRAGQAYLILGKGSGWEMDTSLSNADASFLGEDDFDRAGGVSGAGDVNGDGFDDILISSYEDEEGGYNTGQVYLIFGKESGWAMDTRLSNADASFLGKEEKDRLGGPVGVGDVNDDGYDDFMMRGGGNQDQSNIGHAYLILGKRSGWSMDTPLSTANASFRAENRGDYTSLSVSGAGDVNGDGYDDILMSNFGNDENGDRAGQTYLVLGKRSGWTKGVDLSRSNASFQGERPGDASGSISSAGDVNGDGYDDILIGAHRNDEGGRNTGQTYLVFGKGSGWAMDTNLSSSDASFLGEDVGDETGPVAHAGDMNGDGFDDFLIGVSINSDFAEGSGRTYLILGKASGWGMDTSLSSADASFLGENAGDSSGTFISGTGDVNGDGYDDILISAPYNGEAGIQAGQTYLIGFDFTRPEFLEDSTPFTATTGDPFTFNISILDHYSVGNVNVEYWFGDSGEHTNRTMVLSSGDRQRGSWVHEITIPSDSLDALYFYFSAIDKVGLRNRTAQRMVNVTDNDGPSIEPIDMYSQVTTGQSLSLAATVTDNFGVRGVWLTCRYQDNLTLIYNHSMVPSSVDPMGNGSYIIDNTTVGSHTTSSLVYTFQAVDIHGQWNDTSPITVVVVDDDGPDLIEDLSDDVATTGDHYHARVRVSDNIGVALVNSTASWTPIDVDGNGNGIYELEIAIDADYVGRFYLGITVTDTSGNEAYYELTSREVVDDDPPEIGYMHDVDTWGKGVVYPVPLDVDDNIGVDGIFVEYRIGDGEVVNESAESVFGIPVTRHPEGDLTFLIAAVDEAGNWAWTSSYIVTLINIVPEVADIPVWEVVESSDAELDLSSYITDGNDEDLILECSDEDVSVEGLVLKVRHDTVVPAYTVTITVSDGEDETQAEVTIHVVAVNDPPVITERLPANGTRVKEGKKVILSVTTEDEEGDLVTVTWWDGDEELGSGSPLGVKLKPGEHVIKVVVDDGTDQLEESFTVIVKKEEGSPGFGPVVAMVAVMMACLVARRMH